MKEKQFYHRISSLSVKRDALAILLGTKYWEEQKLLNMCNGIDLMYPYYQIDNNDGYFYDQKEEMLKMKKNLNVKYKCSFILSNIKDDKLTNEIQELIHCYCNVDNNKDRNLVRNLCKKLSKFSNKKPSSNTVSNFEYKIFV